MKICSLPDPSQGQITSTKIQQKNNLYNRKEVLNKTICPTHFPILYPHFMATDYCAQNVLFQSIMI